VVDQNAAGGKSMHAISDSSLTACPTW
jgi:hypothetical protein